MTSTSAIALLIPPSSVSFFHTDSHSDSPYLPLLHPSLSSLSIALSSQYLHTYILLLLVCALWSIVCEVDVLLNPTNMEILGTDYSSLIQFLVVQPEVLERTTLFSTLALSIILLTRQFRPHNTTVYPHNNTHFWQWLVYPRNWCLATTPVFVSVLLCYYLSTTNLLKPSFVLLAGTIVFFLVFPLWIIVVIWPSTVPHPVRIPAAAAPVHTWKTVIAAALLVVIILLPVIGYCLSLCHAGTLCNYLYVHYLSFFLLISMTLPALMGIIFMYQDRTYIKRKLIHSNLTYYIIILTFQLCLPHLLYQGWSGWFFPLYSACSASLWLRIVALIGYHSVMLACQLLVRIFSMLAVTPQHSLAMIFYIQWFEDLMADLTFSTVTPFSVLFFVNAAAQTIKCCIRDGNAMRRLIAYVMDKYTSNTLIIPVQPKKQQATQSLSVSVNAPIIVSASTHAPTDSAINPLIPIYTRTDPPIAVPSLFSVLYASYVSSFDLTLARHQTFLCESCSKCIIVTVILCQYAFPALETAGGWAAAVDSSEKLWLIAALSFLWVMQLMTHAAILYILGLQTKHIGWNSNNADITLQTAHSHSTSTTDKLFRRESACKCGSCVLSFPHYQHACEIKARTTSESDRMNMQQQPVNEEEKEETNECDTSTVNQTWLSRLHTAWNTPIDECVHPVLNYWVVHRWFFMIQMMHWTWFVVIDIPLKYTDRCPE